MKKTQKWNKILKKLKPKFQKNSITGNSSWIELAENGPKKACFVKMFDDLSCTKNSLKKCWNQHSD